jgi:hypothetical protein
LPLCCCCCPPLPFFPYSLIPVHHPHTLAHIHTSFSLSFLSLFN